MLKKGLLKTSFSLGGLILELCLRTTLEWFGDEEQKGLRMEFFL